MAEKNLINLAKGSKSATTKKPVNKKLTTKKSVEKKPVEKKLTVEEERDLKAKETVEKLLEDSPIVSLEKKEELLEIDEPTVEEPKGVEWLEEQVTLLSEKNAALNAELSLAREDYNTLMVNIQQGKMGDVAANSNDGDVKTGVIQLFNELQENHIKLGVNDQGIGNFRIYCPGFLNRMVKFFPFLEQIKRY